MTQIPSRKSQLTQGSVPFGALHLSSPFTPPSQPMSRPERQAAGRALRQTVPRSLHREWQAAEGRRDPIALIEQSNQGRRPELIPIRYWRMMQSPFTFLRGSAIVMTADLATTPHTGIPVQACGDCHLLNFGGFATPERNLVFDINDFDETLVAPWEWDLKRLATSIYVAGQDLQLPDLACAAATRACARAYRLALAQYSQMRTLDVWYAQLDADWLIKHAPDTDTRKHWVDMAKKAFQQNMSRTAQKLTENVNGQRQFVDNYPLLFHPYNRSDYFSEIAALFEHYRDSLQWDRQFLLDRYQLVDVALKVVGVGSVGTHCGVA
ncbi:MAG: DUF2252 family protein, partial [Cyanobacteriota bacterium]